MSLAREIFSNLQSERACTLKSLAVSLGVDLTTLENELDHINNDITFIERYSDGTVALGQVSDVLCLGKIRSNLGLAADRFKFELVSETGSTNDDLLNRIRSGAAQDGVVRISEIQTAGRGTKGRVWLSIPGGSLTFSILRTIPANNVEKGMASIPLVVGLVIARSLDKCAEVTCRLKWPNDVVANGGKLAGVLMESVLVNGVYHLVIGIGINICLPQALIDEVDQPVVDIYRLGSVIDRNLILGKLIEELDFTLERYLIEGFGYFRAEWRELNAYQNQQISFALPDGERCEGEVIDVDENGALVLEVAGKVKRFISGEIQIKLR
ncbi:MAG: biotin--[acetyl-CoA-carboxylase] ligase [Burkholderiales bacterium]|nr:biotin--[acetyl-CoA-carboxylase] ligase [Burkholderiales bacterium]